jgi:hypothetical protein
MADTSNFTVAVPLGQDALVGLNRRDGSLVFSQQFAPGLDTKVNLGRMTRDRIERIQLCLEQLKVHAVN